MMEEQADNSCAMNIVPIPYDEERTVTLEYTADTYYKPQLQQLDDNWHISFQQTAFNEPFHKKLVTDVFDKDFPELKAYEGLVDGRQVGLITLVHETWSNRLRINDLHIMKQYHGLGYGSLLIDFARQQAASIGARALILETQTSNVRAIAFYRKHGFKFIGFDALAYTNDDINRYETRIEMGMTAPFPASNGKIKKT